MPPKTDWEQFYCKRAMMENTTPIAYRSKALSKSEKNYHSSELEFLALKWAVTEHFREYLQYSPEPFLIRSDNNPLTYVMTTPNLDATGH